MDDLYQQQILDLYHEPHNQGRLHDATHHADEVNASCGDSISLDLIITKVKGHKVIKDASFTGGGCAISTAAASLLTDYIKGKKISELESLNFDTMQSILGMTISPGRIKCVSLPAKALIKALHQD